MEKNINIQSFDDQIDQPEEMVLMFFSFKSTDQLLGDIPDVCSPETLQGLFEERTEREDFVGEQGDICLMYGDFEPARRIAFCGLGDLKEASHDVLRQTIGSALREAREDGAERTIAVLPDPERFDADAYELGRAYVEGIYLTEDAFDKYKTEEDDRKQILRDHQYILPSSLDASEFKQGTSDGSLYSKATSMARTLGNEPPSHMTPDELVNVARDFEGEQISVEVFREEELRELGMEPTLGVNAGSDVEPAQILLEYEPETTVDTDIKLGLVGKGITFDSGGLNIKPLDAMMDMKFDMCGAAAVLGVFSVLDELQPQIPVTAMCACAENMTGPEAQKMRDVVESYGGTTIEITHTDAEGRLVMSDALGYLLEKDVSEMIDVATLTGSVITALGREYAGVMGNDEDLIQRIEEAGETSGEQFWQLPLADEYREHLKSPVADVRNTAKKGGAGSITASLFLEHFVEDTPWANLDIAGTAWKDDASGYHNDGATGLPARTLLDLIQKRAEEVNG